MTLTIETGGIVADTRWCVEHLFHGMTANILLRGRYKTICVGVAVGAIAHVLLVIPAIPGIIKHPNGSLAAFIISIIILAFAAGFIKPSLGPLLCDQCPVKVPTVTTTKTGERVIIDPETTVARYFLIFYGCINMSVTTSMLIA